MLHCAIGRSPSFVAWLPMRHTGNFSVYLWDAAGTSTLIGSYPDTSAPVMTVYQVSTRAVVRRYSTSLIQSPRPRTAWTAAPGHGDSAERLCEHPIHRGALPALYPPVSPLRRSRLPCQRTRRAARTCCSPSTTRPAWRRSTSAPTSRCFKPLRMQARRVVGGEAPPHRRTRTNTPSRNRARLSDHSGPMHNHISQ